MPSLELNPNTNGDPGLIVDPGSWEDLVYPLFGKKIDVTNGRLDYNFTEAGIDMQDNCVYFTSPTESEIGNNALIVCHEILHAHVQGTPLRPHVHWRQTQNIVPNFLVEWRWYNVGDIIPSTWGLSKWISNAKSYTSGAMHQLTTFAEIPALPNEEVSSILDIRLWRDTTNVSGLFSGNDPYTGKVTVKIFDVHALFNSFGSRSEYKK